MQTSLHLRTLCITLALVPSLVCSVKEQTPEVIDEETFVKIYVALVEQSPVNPIPSPDTVLTATARAVLSRFEASEEMFRATMEEHSQSPGRWKVFFEKVVKHMEEKQNRRES